jgi:hypothetical protein
MMESTTGAQFGDCEVSWGNFEQQRWSQVLAEYRVLLEIRIKIKSYTARAAATG